MRNTFLISFLSALFLLCSCTAVFEPIDYGHDACTECKMTILDKRYAAEIITKKGKAFKFDDIACLRKYIRDENLPETELTILVADYGNPDGKFLSAKQAIYLHSEMFKSPMSGNLAAFSHENNAEGLIDSLNILALKWEDLK